MSEHPSKLACWWNKVRRTVLGMPDCELVALERETRATRDAKAQKVEDACEDARTLNPLEGLPSDITEEIDLSREPQPTNHNGT